MSRVRSERAQNVNIAAKFSSVRSSRFFAARSCKLFCRFAKVLLEHLTVLGAVETVARSDHLRFYAVRQSNEKRCSAVTGDSPHRPGCVSQCDRDEENVIDCEEVVGMPEKIPVRSCARREPCEVKCPSIRRNRSAVVSVC